jgi:putative transposase
MFRTYKRKLDLTKSQEQRLCNWIGTCRLVYNIALQVKIASYDAIGKSPTNYELQKQITDLRKSYDWIDDVPCNTLANVMDRLDKSYKSFFKGAGFPKFAKKKFYNSLSFRQGTKVDTSKLFISKIGWLKMFADSPIVGDIKLTTIVNECNGFYACITCELPDIVITNTRSIGIDMGITNFAITSNDQFISNPRHFKKHERQLRRENRSLSRKVKFSNSWRKQVKRLSLLHNKIANVRKDFLHKQSTQIANEYATVYMEDLNIKGMSKNRKLSKHILDAGWGMFRIMLEYKTNVTAINPAYTSQTCNACGEKDKVSRISQSEFVCTSCGHIAHADINAAKNIKRIGEALVRQREAVACA